MARQTVKGKLVLLSEAGQKLLEHAFKERIRPRSSLFDFADAYLRALRDTGQLEKYLDPKIDPFKLLKNINEHGLETALNMTEEAFKWPTTKAPKGRGKLSGDDWPEIGLLKDRGYVVGVNGTGQATRRDILDNVYKQRLPQTLPGSYLDEWGKTASGWRLKKMAETIASLVRNAKRKSSPSMDTAIDEWISDLDYLKATYYLGRYEQKFDWPTTILKASRARRGRRL